MEEETNKSNNVAQLKCGNKHFGSSKETHTINEVGKCLLKFPRFQLTCINNKEPY